MWQQSSSFISASQIADWRRALYASWTERWSSRGIRFSDARQPAQTISGIDDEGAEKNEEVCQPTSGLHLHLAINRRDIATECDYDKP